MQPITMTRAEYQMKYGVAPVLPSTSTLDTTPAPRRMTRAEYQAEYGPKQTGSIFDNVLNKINEVNPIYNIGKNAIEGAQDFGAGLGGVLSSTSPQQVIKPTLQALSGGVQGALAIPFGLFESATNLPGIKQAKNFLWGQQEGSLPNMIGNQIGKSKLLQSATNAYPDLPEAAGYAINTGLGLLGGGEAGNPELKQEMLNVKSKVVEPIKSQLDNMKTTRDAKTTTAIADEIGKIENNYAKLRKANEFSKDAEASRQRIAQTDVLTNAVDSTGTIHTKDPGGAVDQYRAQTIDGAESVVRDNLVRLGEKVNAGLIERELTLEINRSGLEGSDLITALNGVKKEVAGLKLRGDELGDIPLEKVHDAKINTTKNIDYNTPSETKTYRKAVARAYKTIVEDNSSFNVKEVNKELSKYYEDIGRLEALDGRKVKGGKLGKYTAQIAGNIAGGAIGGAIGGLPGTAVGTLIGGETASFIKGKQMSGTFGEARGLEVPKNDILEKAKLEGKQEPKVDLTKPSAKVGAPKNIPKTKEIFRLEKEIRDNVDAQTKAIKVGDFTLVQKLKEIYDHLVSKLKEVVKKVKETPNKQGGFINIGGKKFSEIPEATKAEIVQVIDYLRNGKEVPKIEDTVSRLARKYNINEDWSNSKIANSFQDLIEKTKTSEGVSNPSRTSKSDRTL